MGRWKCENTFPHICQQICKYNSVFTRIKSLIKYMYSAFPDFVDQEHLKSYMELKARLLGIETIRLTTYFLVYRPIF